eukprot:GILI01001676.1.p1 GENE.GILI01001676.1~~GILI01001676.1.p1  ORF type:complete len:373 (-),score=167.24 GILI01001676.1:310-1377(-)
MLASVTLKRVPVAQQARAFSSAVQAKVARIVKHASAEDAIKIETENLSAPTGSEVLVKFLAAPVNPADFNIIEGTYGELPKLPAVAGNEGVAVVVAAGPSAKLKANDVVVPALPGFGTWRTHAVCPEAALQKIPSDLPVEYAATLAVNPCTAFRLLADFESLKAGDVLIQNGANSTVGQAVIQLAKEKNVKTINIIRNRPEQDKVVERLKTLGADVVVTEDVLGTADFKKVLSDLPAPRLGLNCVGGASVTEMARILGNKSTLVTYGGMSKKPVTVSTSSLLFKDISLRGFWLSKWVQSHSAAERAAMFDQLVPLIKAGKLKMLLERHSFSDLHGALAKARQPFHDRKIVLTMDK